MHRRSLALVMILLIASCVTRGQWDVQQLPIADDLSGVYFSDTLRGWVSGGGKLLRTTDGGYSWNAQPAYVGKLSGVGALGIWALGGHDSIAHTTDGGGHFEWSSLQSFFGLDSVVTLDELFFLDTLHGWVVGSGWSNGNHTTKLIRTVDGGDAWSAESVATSTFSASHPLVQFLDSINGWLTDDADNPHYTTDGGHTWDTLGYVGYITRTDLQFITSKTGWIAGDGPAITSEVWKTADGGQTWISPLSFQYSENTTRVRFADTSNGWVAQYTGLDGGHSEIWHTSDGGSNWDLQFSYSPPFSFRPRKFFFLDRYHGWLIGCHGIVLHSINGGVTQVDGNPPSCLAPSNSLHIYPNPFNSGTRIEILLNERSFVSITVYDLLGREIRKLWSGDASPGFTILPWDGRNQYGQDMGTGFYVFQLVSYIKRNPTKTSSMRALLMR